MLLLLLLLMGVAVLLVLRMLLLLLGCALVVSTGPGLGRSRWCFHSLSPEGTRIAVLWGQAGVAESGGQVGRETRSESAAWRSFSRLARLLVLL